MFFSSHNAFSDFKTCQKGSAKFVVFANKFDREILISSVYKYTRTRVDQIFRLSCLRRRVLGWVKKIVHRNKKKISSASSCSAGLPKFLRVLNRTPNFLSEIGRIWYQKICISTLIPTR